MDALSVVSLFPGVSRLKFWTEFYGSQGIILFIFGNIHVLHMELEVLLSDSEDIIMGFKKSIQDESSMIAIAATIVAQIAITAMSLTDLANVHWTARGFFVFSLASSIISVYHSSRQYLTLGRCLRAAQIKSWIKNEDAPDEAARRAYNEAVQRLPSRLLPVVEAAILAPPKRGLPSVASILTRSAPVMLLYASLSSLLIGLGIYLGFVWTKQLGGADPQDSHAVFLTYIIGGSVCYCIYAQATVFTSGTALKESDVWRLAHEVAEAARVVARDDHNQEANTSIPLGEV